MKILIGSPVRQHPIILENFLLGLNGLKIPTNVIVDYYFVDDNNQDESKSLLYNFMKDKRGKISNCTDDGETYRTDGKTHEWTEALMDKVAKLKDGIIDYAIENYYDYLFFVDSDLILHPNTISHLLSLNKDIVSEVFWTKWTPDQPYSPQVWVSGQYDFFKESSSCRRTSQQALEASQNFIRLMYSPGCYKVGGLGACTLISKAAICKGVRFQSIPNLNYSGEDRHFCVRAMSLGIDLWADTTLPPVHLYRANELAVNLTHAKLIRSETWLSKSTTILLDNTGTNIETLDRIIISLDQNLSGLNIQNVIVNSSDHVTLVQLDPETERWAVTTSTERNARLIGNYTDLLIGIGCNWLVNIRPQLLQRRQLERLLGVLLEESKNRHVEYIIKEGGSGSEKLFARALRFTPFFDYHYCPTSLFPKNLDLFHKKLVTFVVEQ